jgi:hypothetical protein
VFWRAKDEAKKKKKRKKTLVLNDNVGKKLAVVEENLAVQAGHGHRLENRIVVRIDGFFHRRCDFLHHFESQLRVRGKGKKVRCELFE